MSAKRSFLTAGAIWLLAIIPASAAPDYTYTCDPDVIDLAAGMEASILCTVQSTQGFTGTVDFACSAVGLPPGAYCSHDPASVFVLPDGTAMTALTVATVVGTPPGSYVFEAESASLPLAHAAVIALNIVAPPPSFAVACNPAILVVTRGASASASCAIDSYWGFSASVSASCTGSPAGVTCAFTPPSVTPPPNGSAPFTVTVSANATAAPGTRTFRVQGSSGAMTRSFVMTLTVSAESADPLSLTVDGAGDGVLEPNETATVAPRWWNSGTLPIALSGTASSFSGPAGPLYVIDDASADYGPVAVGAIASCEATGDCYRLRASAAARPATHWDATFVETVTTPTPAQTWVVHIGHSFADVAPGNAFYRFVETLLHRNVTAGCSEAAFCPVAATTRAQMAVFMLVAREPPGYTPPPCATVAAFADVPTSSPFCRWVEELARRGVVTGCGADLYCPSSPATREQMAVFVLRALDPALSPPSCGAPMFADVPASSPFCRWIEELARRGVVTGCGGGSYCPAAAITREQMSVFLTITFGLVLYGV